MQRTSLGGLILEFFYYLFLLLGFFFKQNYLGQIFVSVWCLLTFHFWIKIVVMTAKQPKPLTFCS